MKTPMVDLVHNENHAKESEFISDEFGLRSPSFRKDNSQTRMLPQSWHASVRDTLGLISTTRSSRQTRAQTHGLTVRGRCPCFHRREYRPLALLVRWTSPKNKPGQKEICFVGTEELREMSRGGGAYRKQEHTKNSSKYCNTNPEAITSTSTNSDRRKGSVVPRSTDQWVGWVGWFAAER